VHFYWIGAVPAMVFLGIVMMPFYYNSKVRSVPEYLRLRFNDATHVLNSLSFAVATVLIAGVNLFAMALVIRLLLGRRRPGPEPAPAPPAPGDRHRTAGTPTRRVAPSSSRLISRPTRRRAERIGRISRSKPSSSTASEP
jgi:Sodium:solute symporter family